MGKDVHTIESEELTYISKVDNNGDIMFRRSIGDVWNDSAKGGELGTLKDDGNNVIIKMNNVDLSLDYSEFCELVSIIEIKLLVDTNMRGEFKHVILE